MLSARKVHRRKAPPKRFRCFPANLLPQTGFVARRLRNYRAMHLLNQGDAKGALEELGKPLPKASVTFAPMATKESPNPGPTAQGLTDADGRYQLSVDYDNTSGSTTDAMAILYLYLLEKEI